MSFPGSSDTVGKFGIFVYFLIFLVPAFISNHSDGESVEGEVDVSACCDVLSFPYSFLSSAVSESSSVCSLSGPIMDTAWTSWAAQRAADLADQNVVLPVVDMRPVVATLPLVAAAEAFGGPSRPCCNGRVFFVVPSSSDVEKRVLDAFPSAEACLCLCADCSPPLRYTWPS